MGEPAEFSEANDPPEENEQRSPYLRIKSKVSKKINKKFDSLTREIGEEWDEHGEQLDSASGVVNDLVEPETLQRWSILTLENIKYLNTLYFVHMRIPEISDFER